MAQIRRFSAPILKRLPLRAVLTIPLALQIVVVVGLVASLSQISGQQTIDKLARQFLEEAHDQVEQHLQSYMGQAQQIVRLIVDDIELGHIQLESQNLQTLDSYFLKRIQTFNRVNFIYVGNQQGKLIGAGQRYQNDRPTYLIEVTDDTTNGQYTSYAVNALGKRTLRLSTLTNYDPRRRPWYQAAVTQGTATWSEIAPLIGAADQGLTITAVRPFYGKTDKIAGVAAVDLSLNHIDSFLKSLKIAKSGQVFVLEPSGTLIASSSPQPPYTTVKGEVKRAMAINSNHPLMRSTVQQIEQHLGPLTQIYQPQQIAFKLHSRRYLAQITPWQDEFGLSWLIVAVLPETDFMAQIYIKAGFTLLVCTAATLIAALASVATTRWVIAPIQKLNQAVKDIAKGQWEKAIAIDRADEVGELARSFNQMAAQLRVSFDALYEGQQQLAKFLEAVPNGICVIEPSGKISYMNQMAQDLLGQPFHSNLLLQTLADQCKIQIAGASHPYPLEHLPAVRALQGESSTVEDIEIARDEQLIPLEMRATPILDTEGKVSYAIVAFQDIQDRKQAERVLADYNRILATQIAERTAELTHANLELEQAKQAAETANHAKSAFLANMSHELRTPLNAILGFAQIMSRDPQTTSAQYRHLSIINRSGEHLLSLINNVLDLSKIEAGRVDLTETPFNLTELLETIDSLLHQQAAVKGLQFQIVMAPNMPRQVISDASKLRQILINLIGNAIKFTEYGSVILRVRTENALPDTDKTIPSLSNRDIDRSSRFKTQLLVFEVEDTGIGIPAEELDRIFHAFEQSSKGKITPEGTGLGLTISCKFIELMHGTISVTSTPNVGSRFTIKLPIHTTAEPILDYPRQRLVTGVAPGQPRYRILIVDDQPENRELLVRMLTPLRLESREAVNGQDAIACCQAWLPHLVLLDIYMPTLDGFSTAQQIRQLEQQSSPAPANSPPPKVKIIALSASVLEDDRQKALAMGCDGFLGKPFQASELYEAIGQQLELQYRYADPTSTVLIPPPDPIDQPSPPDEANHPLVVPPLLSRQPLSLDFMPPAWQEQLYQAALCCCDEQVIELLQQIPPNHDALSRQLQCCAEKFQFEMILQLLHGYSRKDQV